MSQGGANNVTGSGADGIETLTGNSGGAVGPDGAFNIDIVGNNAVGIDIVGTPGSNLLTIIGLSASETQVGTVELATAAETTTGTSTSLAVHPAGLNTKLGTQTSNGLIYGQGGAGTTLGALAEATDGQLPIGSVGNPPTLATLTAGAATAISNGAGSITIDASSNFETTGMHGWNGSILETVDVTVTSAAGVITCSVQKSGGGNLTVVFSDGYDAWTTAPDTVTLTAGSDASPTLNYVYYLQSTKTLTASTVSFPSAEHAPIATVLCQSAASLQTDGAYKVHVWTDHLVTTNDQGHIGDLNLWIRNQNATWIDGVAQTYTITANGGAADNVILTTASGNVLQLHSHAFPAFGGTPDIYVINDSVTPYTKVTDLNALLTDSAGGSMSGRYFSLVIWGVVSEASADCKLYCNLPDGSYNNQAGVTRDLQKRANYTIPSDFKGTGFLISEWKLRHQVAASGTWTSIDEIDLRGLIPAITAGGSSAITSEFVDNAFRIVDDGDNTKEIAFEASGITTGTTRTITMLDANIDLANVVQASAALTDFLVVCGNGGDRGTQSIAGIGSSGQVLTSNGAGVLPTFQAATSSTFTVNAQVFTSSGTYTPTAGMDYCIVEVVGGGGGSGGCQTTAAGQVAASGGGGGGGYSREIIDAATIGASQVVTVGTGGIAGAAGPNVGGTGVTSSLGALISAAGGLGGGGGAANAGLFVGSGGAGGAGASGDFNTTGDPGGYAFYSGSTPLVQSGNGGSTFFGGGALGISSPGAAVAGVSHGGGAAGGALNVSSTQIAGAAGADGIIVITEFVG